MGHPMRIELTRVGLLVYLANHYTTRGAPVTLGKSWQLFCLFLLLNGISTFLGYLMPRQSFYKNSSGSWEDKRVHTFPKGICPEVKVIARLEFELAYFDSVVQCFNNYATKTLYLNYLGEENKGSYSSLSSFIIIIIINIIKVWQQHRILWLFL